MRTEDHNESCVNYYQCILRGQKITTNHVSTTSVHYTRTEDHNESCVNYHQCTIRGQKITTNHVSTTISASYEDRRSQRIMCQLPSVHPTRTEDHNESCVNYHQCILRGQKITTNHVSTTISASYEDRRSQRIMCQLPSVHPMRTEDHNESCVNYYQCIIRGQKITTNHVSTTISALYEDRRSQRIMCQLPSVHHTRTEDHNESCVNYHQCILRGQKITTNHVSTTISALYEDRRSQRIMCQLPSVHPTRTEDHNESCVNYHQCTIRGQKITTNHVSTTISAPYEDRRSQRIMCQLPSVHPIRTEDHNESCVNYHQCILRGQKITTNHVSTTISASYEDRRSQRIMCQLPSVHPYEDRRSQRIMCQLPSVHPIRGQKITTNHVSTTISAPYEDRRSQRIMCQLPSVHPTRTEDHNESCVNYHQCTIRGQKITTNHVSTTISALYEDRRSQRIMCQLPSVHPIRGQKITTNHVSTTISDWRTEDHNESCVNYHQCILRGQKITTNHVSTTISASYEDRRSQRIMCQLPSVHPYEDRRSQRIMCQLPSVHPIRGQKITTNHVSTTISASYEDRRSQRIMCQLPSVHPTRTEDHNESCVNYHQCIHTRTEDHTESCVNYHQCIIRGQKITTNHVSTTISAPYEDRRSQRIMCQLPSVLHTRTEDHNESCVNYHQCTYEDRRSQRIMCQLPSVHPTRTEDHNESCVNYHQCTYTRTEDHNESCVNYHQCIRRSQRIMCQLPSVLPRTEDHNESCVNYHQCIL